MSELPKRRHITLRVAFGLAALALVGFVWTQCATLAPENQCRSYTFGSSAVAVMGTISLVVAVRDCCRRIAPQPLTEPLMAQP